MPNGQGPLSYMYDSAAMNKTMPFMTATAPMTPGKPSIPKTPTTPVMPNTPLMNKMSAENAESLCKIAHQYTMHKNKLASEVL